MKAKPKRSLHIPLTKDRDSEDEELMNLSANHLSAGLHDGPLGRTQPFTPMVNREMLCSLVRRSFRQTEEQQLQFEQILRHEYGRKSKGEVRERKEDITDKRKETRREEGRERRERREGLIKGIGRKF